MNLVLFSIRLQVNVSLSVNKCVGNNVNDVEYLDSMRIICNVKVDASYIRVLKITFSQHPVIHPNND